MPRSPVVRAFLGDEVVADSFAGGGGASEGILRALGRGPDVAINHDAEALAMHAANHPETRHYCESVYDVDPSEVAGGRRGETFRAFVRKLERLGYTVEHRLLRACDYGAPTTRRRLFLIARCDGRPIVWPQPTHAPVGDMYRRPYRTAAECIDWSIPCPSIFDRERPLADKTLARIARGVHKYVLGSARPFIVPYYGDRRGGEASRARTVDEPVPTQTTANRFALVAPYLVHRSNGERVGQAPRIYDVQRPIGTIVAQGQKHALCAAFLAKHYGERATGGWNGGAPLDRPADTITVRDHHALVATHLIKFQGTSEAHLDASAVPVDAPMPTITAQGWKLAQVAAFLVKYYGAEVGQDQAVSAPLDTITTKPRFGLVTVTVDGEEYVIVDIGMRMLTPRELFRAQGFDDRYRIDPAGPSGKPLTKTAQIRMCGNSVPPPVVEALLRSNVMEAS